MQRAVVISNPNNNLQESRSQLLRAGTLKSLKSEGLTSLQTRNMQNTLIMQRNVEHKTRKAVWERR